MRRYPCHFPASLEVESQHGASPQRGLQLHLEEEPERAVPATPGAAPRQDGADAHNRDPGPLHVVRLSGPEAMFDIAEDWQRLDALMRPRAPFSSLLWNSLWWKHYHKRGVLMRDEFLVLAVRAPSSRLVAIAPLFRRSCPAIGPASLRMVQFFGADAYITELRGVVCAPADHMRVLDALETYFRGEYRAWDLLRWDGACGHDRQHAGRLAGAALHSNYILPLPASWPELHSRITGNFRRNLRRQRELFERDAHAYTFCIRERPEELAKALETLFALHAQRAEFKGMQVKHPNRFAEPVNRQFLREYTLEMAARGSARVCELHIGSKPVASQLTFAIGRDLWLYASGFDPHWRRYGVMTMLTVEIMQWAIASQYEHVNLSCGHDRGKLRWRPEEIAHGHFLKSTPGVRGRLAKRAYATVRGWRRARGRLRDHRDGAAMRRGACSQ